MSKYFSPPSGILLWCLSVAGYIARKERYRYRYDDEDKMDLRESHNVLGFICSEKYKTIFCFGHDNGPSNLLFTMGFL
jgi:hypothetical protein